MGIARPAYSYVNAILRLRKWPAAGLSLLLFFPAVATLLDVARVFLAHASTEAVPLALGIAAYVIRTWRSTGRILQTGFRETDQHERTHMLFARLAALCPGALVVCVALALCLASPHAGPAWFVGSLLRHAMALFG